MKKIIIAISLAALLSAACGSKAMPSDTAQDCARDAVRIGEQYLEESGSYTAEEVCGDLEHLMYDWMDYVTSDNRSEYPEDYTVKVHIDELTNAVFFDTGDDASREKIEKAIEELKKDLAE